MLEVHFNPFPGLSTGRLELREITSDDAATIFSLRSDDRIMRFLGRRKAGSIEEAREWIRKVSESLAGNEGITWGICRPADSTLIGTVGFWRIFPEHYLKENFFFNGKFLDTRVYSLLNPSQKSG